MPAYMLIAAVIKDRDKFIAGYGKAAGDLVAKYGGRYMARAPGAIKLEGAFGDNASVAISEWPDRASAERFWNSPEYAEARKLREGLAEVQVLLIDLPEGLAR